MATTNGFICECHLITKLPFSSANASISMQGVSSVCEPRLRLCICMWALCLPICCAVTGEEIIRSSTGTNNHRLWGSDSAAGAGETRQQSTQREWRKEEESVVIHTTDSKNIANTKKCRYDGKYDTSQSRYFSIHTGCVTVTVYLINWFLTTQSPFFTPSE